MCYLVNIGTYTVMAFLWKQPIAHLLATGLLLLFFLQQQQQSSSKQYPHCYHNGDSKEQLFKNLYCIATLFTLIDFQRASFRVGLHHSITSLLIFSTCYLLPFYCFFSPVSARACKHAHCILKDWGDFTKSVIVSYLLAHRDKLTVC